MGLVLVVSSSESCVRLLVNAGMTKSKTSWTADNESLTQNRVSVSASLLPIIGAAVSAVLLILSVLIIILLVKRRQKQRNKETQLKCSFKKRGSANTYAGGSQDNKYEDDDEADYENVELDENMDHNDYEQDCINIDSDHSEEDDINVDADDSEEDDINVDVDDSEEDYVNVDTDDSEEDYVNANVTKNKSVLDKSDDNIYESCCA
ncbi:glutamic acid-rich protein-like [Megalobrama amblycephala]|uniref:glutamic acid-rich protein-like n=1 Tax=Megalobrama amblycephala TaxID=75352 RepID=UPI0020141B3D|nr:glutamic acid-rich protein-like [Megalobrama amblycephala]